MSEHGLTEKDACFSLWNKVQTINKKKLMKNPFGEACHGGMVE